MIEDKEDDYEYLVPRNVVTRFQFFPGFGWKELFILIFGIIIGILSLFAAGMIARFLPIVVGMVLRLIALAFPIAVAFLGTQKDPKTGLSVIEMVKDFKNYSIKQRRYEYGYGTGRSKENDR